jgi:hypothetical protein
MPEPRSFKFHWQVTVTHWQAVTAAATVSLAVTQRLGANGPATVPDSESESLAGQAGCTGTDSSDSELPLRLAGAAVATLSRHWQLTHISGFADIRH